MSSIMDFIKSRLKGSTAMSGGECCHAHEGGHEHHHGHHHVHGAGGCCGGHEHHEEHAHQHDAPDDDEEGCCTPGKGGCC